MPDNKETTAFVNCATVCCVMIMARSRTRVRATDPSSYKLLLIRRADPTQSAYDELALPGGFQKGAIAESVRLTAVREVREELGLDIDIGKLQLVNVETDDYHHNVIFFRYEYDGDEASLRDACTLNQNEVTEIVFVDRPVKTGYASHTAEIEHLFENLPLPSQPL